MMMWVCHGLPKVLDAFYTYERNAQHRHDTLGGRPALCSGKFPNMILL